MSFVEDDQPKKPAAHELGSDLTLLSIEELKDRIALLQDEISRLEAECERKASGRQAAEKLFRF
ncbi:DUF1192 domain-containing protein [Rhizobium sp. BK251]|uniref:DUF1192 domain-containing protein n=1 Tax=Rhizobium sp. BK251 TaxID=2512125 RepID=UPI0010533C67|nr:DUF1192 domain-containing protein [Rhizobium sp. BK251]TCL69770.1 uncharacterized small protein (DUF1192 family) [Rhizobium sp. BK251]